MSYKPPTTKSAYGDTDFTYDDNWSNQGSSQQSFEPPPQANLWSAESARPQPVASQTSDLQQNPVAQAPAQPMMSMTQEDLLFMRNYNRDCLFNRGKFHGRE